MEINARIQRREHLSNLLKISRYGSKYIQSSTETYRNEFPQSVDLAILEQGKYRALDLLAAVQQYTECHNTRLTDRQKLVLDRWKSRHFYKLEKPPGYDSDVDCIGACFDIFDDISFGGTLGPYTGIALSPRSSKHPYLDLTIPYHKYSRITYGLKLPCF